MCKWVQIVQYIYHPKKDVRYEKWHCRAKTTKVVRSKNRRKLIYIHIYTIDINFFLWNKIGVLWPANIVRNKYTNRNWVTVRTNSGKHFRFAKKYCNKTQFKLYKSYQLLSFEYCDLKIYGKQSKIALQFSWKYETLSASSFALLSLENLSYLANFWHLLDSLNESFGSSHVHICALNLITFTYLG